MKINKSNLSKSLKQIGIFVSKNNISQNASLVHFKNHDNSAMMFATDLVSAGRVYFDTEETGDFEFCVEYNQLVQSTKVRSKEINVEINGNNIEFFDDKTKFTWVNHAVDALVDIENKTVVPSDVSKFGVKSTVLKKALKEAGYARNEKDMQNPYVTGVNFIVDKNICSMASTDRHRIASWKQDMGVDTGLNISGVLSPKTIQSIMLFDDDVNIDIYITDNQIILSSDKFEAYAPKIQCNFPALGKFFEKECLSVYEINTKDMIDSLSIVESIGSQSMTLSFKDNNVVITATSNNTSSNVEDNVACNKISGNDEVILIDPSLFGDIFKNISSEKIKIEFREMREDFKILSYSTEDGAYGMIAPQRK